MHLSHLPFVANLLFGLRYATASPKDGPHHGPKVDGSHNDSVWPRSIIPEVQKFIIDHFQHLDDTSGKDPSTFSQDCDIYTSDYTSDATFSYGGSTAQGTAAIKETCLGLYKSIHYRKHDYYHAYSFGQNTYEIGVHGSVQIGNDSVRGRQRGLVDVFELKEIDESIKIQSETLFSDP